MVSHLICIQGLGVRLPSTPLVFLLFSKASGGRHDRPMVVPNEYFYALEVCSVGEYNPNQKEINMKIFNQVEGWTTKVNFVDENNVILGYDLSQDCCEYADWFIADEVTNDANFFDINVEEGREADYTEYRFDTEFFMEFDNDQYEVEAVVVFRITDGKNEKFIHLFNVHNGYYGHGFDFTINDQVTRDGYL